MSNANGFDLTGLKLDTSKPPILPIDNSPKPSTPKETKNEDFRIYSPIPRYYEPSRPIMIELTILCDENGKKYMKVDFLENVQ